MNDPNVERDAMIARLQQAVSTPASPERPTVVIERKKVESFDEAMLEIARIAADPNNRDQFKALKAITQLQQSSIALDEPMTDSEVIEDMAVLMKASGKDLCAVAYRKAFPSVRGASLEDAPKLYMDDLSNEDLKKVERVTSLKSLYKMFPEIKRSGMPNGFPIKGGIEVRKTWCRKAAARILLDRKQAEVVAAAEADKNA